MTDRREVRMWRPYEKLGLLVAVLLSALLAAVFVLAEVL